ncbi:hypothetical protein GCM10020331_001590 [Ectobacillus funiculus]
MGDVEDAVNQLRYYAGLATKPHGQTYDVPDDIQAMVVREPIGVVGLIVPWNYPLVMANQKNCCRPCCRVYSSSETGTTDTTFCYSTV